MPNVTLPILAVAAALLLAASSAPLQSQEDPSSKCRSVSGTP
ncbi:MAG: hypothetical protein V3U74_03205 [Thermodesulfobacteriota bacterium]